MDLHLERPGDYPYVHHVERDAIAVVHGEESYRLTGSFILTDKRIIEHWAVSSPTELGAGDLEPILELQPDVVLLGTGSRQIFPSGEVMAACLQRGVGIEPMDNAAAARTHTILTGEDRRVVAAFILCGGTTD